MPFPRAPSCARVASWAWRYLLRSSAADRLPGWEQPAAGSGTTSPSAALAAPCPEKTHPLPLTAPPARRDPQRFAATAARQTSASASGAARPAACWDLEFGARPSAAGPHSGRALGLLRWGALGAEPGSGSESWRYCSKMCNTSAFSWMLLLMAVVPLLGLFTK